MQTPLSSVALTELSIAPRWVTRYFFEPIDRIGQVLLWSSTTFSVTLGTIQFFLIIVTRIIPHFALLGCQFSRISRALFKYPHWVLLLWTIFLVWVNIYSVKKTRQAYKELRVWAISIRFSWRGRNGERRTFTLRHLTMEWSNTKKNIPSLRVLSIAVFQCIALVWQRINPDQQVSSSGALAVEHSGETMAAVMTVISEGPSCLSDAGPPVKEQATVASGIFATVLSACQIRLVGPTGKTRVIDLQHRACLPLWLYLIARTATGGWVSVGSILQDVYGYDGVVINEQTGEVQDPKVRIKDRFHNQCATLRRLIEDACVEVGLRKTNIFHQKNEHKTSYWRLLMMYT